MVQTTLKEVKRAIEREDDARVVELVEPLVDAFAASRERELALDTVARVVRSKAGGDDGRTADVAQSVVELTSEAGMVQTRVDAQLRAYLDGEDRADPVAAIDGALDVYDSLDAKADSLTAAKGDVTVPELLVLSTPRWISVPKGVPVDGSVTVSNVGGQATGSVSLSLKSSADVGLETVTLDGIAPDGTASVELVGTPGSADTFRTTVTAETDDSSESSAFQLVVNDKRDYLEEALDQLRDLYLELRTVTARAARSDSGEPAGSRKSEKDGRGGLSGLEGKLETVTKRAVRTIGTVEDGKANAANGQIGASLNDLSAFVQQVDAQDGKQLDSADAALLKDDVRAVVSALEAAERAAI